jgi:hypothetical protein
MCALVAAALTLVPFTAFGQTNAAHVSTVGAWKLDAAKSSFGSEPAPKALTLTILKDTPQSTAWRVDIVDDKGQAISYSWSGPADGSMHPVKGAKGQVIAQEGLKQDSDGAMRRHGVDNTDASTFDACSTLSADGNTITDVMTTKMKDGTTSKATIVYNRAKSAK